METKEVEAMSNSDELHPVRFTNKQVRFLMHMMDEFFGFFEDDCAEAMDVIRKAEGRLKGG